jgi:hypothetical protein
MATTPSISSTLEAKRRKAAAKAVRLDPHHPRGQEEAAPEADAPLPQQPPARNGDARAPPGQSLTPYEFAALEKISRAYLYTMWRRGTGPRFYMIGNRRRITMEARAEWQRSREVRTGK